MALSLKHRRRDKETKYEEDYNEGAQERLQRNMEALLLDNRLGAAYIVYLLGRDLVS